MAVAEFPSAVLPASVTVSIDAIIEAAATFSAYAQVASIFSGRSNDAALSEGWNSSSALLNAAGLITQDDKYDVPLGGWDGNLQARLEAREAEITAGLLHRFAAFALTEARKELGEENDDA